MEDATTTTIDPEQFEYECTFPGCAKRYARKDAVKKHAKEKHPTPHMGDAQRFTKAWLAVGIMQAGRLCVPKRAARGGCGAT